MAALTPEDLFAFLDRQGIAHRTYPHAPVFTVAESAELKRTIPGGHSKNLFLKDKKGALFLLSALADTAIDLNALSRVLGAARFSFGSPDRLLAHLGVTPGSVTAFAILNDPENTVTFVLDDALFDHDLISFHPLRNDATTVIAAADLLKFARALGREPIRLRFDAAGLATRIEA